jgi:hypothetical protein
MRAFVVAELGLSTLALIAAALMTKGALIESRSRLRFDPSGIVTTGIDASTLPPGADGARAVAEVLRRLEADPIIERAATTDVLPGLRAPQRTFAIVGRAYSRAADLPATGVAMIGGDLFGLLGIQSARGRFFRVEDDMTAQRVAIASESFVARHLAGVDPLGARVRLAEWPPDSSAAIVGVVPDPGTLSRVVGSGEVLWLASAQHQVAATRLVVRGRDLDATASRIRSAITGAHADLPHQAIGTLERDLREARRAARTLATVFAASGVAGLILAVLGVYGVVAARVRERRRELAIRGALGASPARLMFGVMAAGARDLGVALVVGVGLAAAFTPTLEGILFGVDPHDPDVFGAVVATLVISALAAVVRPALMAARTPPGAALNE